MLESKYYDITKYKLLRKEEEEDIHYKYYKEYYIDLKNNKEAVIYIHNRFGKLLTSFSPSRGFWDGTYNGKQMPSNDYWFKVEYVKDGKEKQFVANFTLKR